LKSAFFASNVWCRWFLSVCRRPSRCPYCPADALAHWILWGYYTRYAGDPDDSSRREDIQRYRCAITRRTFSLLPDSLLPYCGVRTGELLSHLQALFVQGIATSSWARHAGVARGTLRGLKVRFLRTLPKLRLPGREGALKAPSFLTVLAASGPAAITELFRDWKELEPKLAVVGIYPR
jgi:hypothetical protein